MWSYLRRQRSFLVLTGCLVAAMVGLDLLGPLLLRRAIDHHIVPRDLDGLLHVVLLMLGVYASSASLNLLQSYIMAGAAQRTMRDIRADLFHKLQHLPLEFFDRRVHGELMARLTSDVESINQVLSNSVSQLVSGGLSTLAIAITMVILNPLLGALAVLTVASLTIGLNRWLAANLEQAGSIGSPRRSLRWSGQGSTLASCLSTYGERPRPVQRAVGVVDLGRTLACAR